MGALCCCFHERHSQLATENSNDSACCFCPCCFLVNLFTERREFERIEAENAVGTLLSSTELDTVAASTTTSIASGNSSVTGRSQRASQANRDRSQNPSLPLPVPVSAKSLSATTHNQELMGFWDDEVMKEKKLAQTREVVSNEFDYDHLLCEECPTCLEGYDFENPKIVAKCSHHFHLSCIYEWQERSDTCPICSGVMVFEETN